jgi:hypothetical protein
MEKVRGRTRLRPRLERHYSESGSSRPVCFLLSARSQFPTLLCLAQPLRHLLVVRSVISPSLGGSTPPIIADRHVDASVDEELHGFVVFVKAYQLMQDAGRLMGAPVRVDIGPMLEKKVGYFEAVADDRPRRALCREPVAHSARPIAGLCGRRHC